MLESTLSTLFQSQTNFHCVNISILIDCPKLIIYFNKTLTENVKIYIFSFFFVVYLKIRRIFALYSKHKNLEIMKKRFDYRTKFMGKTLIQLEELLPYYKEQFYKYLGGHPENQREAFRDLNFLESKIDKIKSKKQK